MRSHLALSILCSTALAYSYEPTLPWVLNTHNTDDCSDVVTNGYSGFDILDAHQECVPSKFPSGTKALWFRDSETAAHVLSLHSSDTCSDTAIKEVNLPAGTSGVCIQIDSESQRFSLRRADYSSVAAGTRSTNALATRMPDSEFYAWFLSRRQTIYTHVAATIVACSTPFWAACGFGILVSVVETSFLAFETWRYTHHRAGTTRSIGGLWDEPVQLDGYVEGKTIRVTNLDLTHDLAKRDASALAGRELDPTHVFMQFDFIDQVTGQIESTFADFDPATNETIASAPADGKFGAFGSGHFHKRDVSDYTVHYQSMDMSERARDLFPISRNAANKLSDEIWNWGRENNIGGKCASLIAHGEQLNRGYFAIKTGPFTAHRDC